MAVHLRQRTLPRSSLVISQHIHAGHGVDNAVSQRCGILGLAVTLFRWSGPAQCVVHVVGSNPHVLRRHRHVVAHLVRQHPHPGEAVVVVEIAKERGLAGSQVYLVDARFAVHLALAVAFLAGRPVELAGGVVKAQRVGVLAGIYAGQAYLLVLAGLGIHLNQPAGVAPDAVYLAGLVGGDGEATAVHILADVGSLAVDRAPRAEPRVFLRIFAPEEPVVFLGHRVVRDVAGHVAFVYLLLGIARPGRG